MNVWRVVVGLCVVMGVVAQQGARMYPGARLDRAATAEAKNAATAQADLEVAVYTTTDEFDKVCGFFAKSGKEYKPIGSRARKLPNGQELRDAFFILDDAASVMTSKHWVKIQRPYIGPYGLARGGQSGIEDVTAIVVTRKK
jgi:hypothetical protein